MKPHNVSNYYFWFLSTFAAILLVMSVAISWQYGQEWLRTLWHICQARLQSLGLAWPMLIPTLFTLIIIRGGLSLLHQVRATQGLADAFRPLRESPPVRLQPLLTNLQLTSDDVVFLKLATPHAFCLGLWRPRIWLTSELTALLSDDELLAVLAHENYHRRLRDPLRLVISRALRAAFFFLPLVKDLAIASELQQEIAADQAAITHLGDDLPLLCALQKLLQQNTASNPTATSAVLSPFNVTEARLRRLIYPPSPPQWRKHSVKWVTNIGIILLLGSTIFLSAQPTAESVGAVSCSSGSADSLQTRPPTWLDHEDYQQ